jgi:hypothetical protein
MTPVIQFVRFAVYRLKQAARCWRVAEETMSRRFGFVVLLFVAAAMAAGCQASSSNPAVEAAAAPESVPVAAAPASAGPAGAAPAAVAPTVAPGSPGAWFAETGCTACHSISVYDLKSPANVGPDLSIAVEDVKTRFGVTLEQFLEQPTGTMGIVLMAQIPLTPEQKKVALANLHAAYEEYQKRQPSQ